MKGSEEDLKMTRNEIYSKHRSRVNERKQEESCESSRESSLTSFHFVLINDPADIGASFMKNSRSHLNK